MKLIKLSLTAALVATMSMASDITSEIGVSANISMTSVYMWRGMDQTSGSPATQGGFDLDYKGFYVGVWGSNVDNNLYGDANMEFDLYGGYSSEIAGIGYDIGYLQFFYPGDTKTNDWGEAYIELSKDFDVVSIAAKASFGVKTDTWSAENLYEAFVSVPLPYDLSFDAAYGFYDNIGQYYAASITKSIKSYDFTLAYTGMVYDNAYTTADNEGKAVFTIGTSF